jgi:RHS repeat-associated protein
MIDAAGDLRTIQDVDEQTAATLDYDTSHRLTHYRDKRAGDWDYSYDFAGSMASLTAPVVPADGVNKRPLTSIVSWQVAQLVNPGSGNSLNTPAPPLRADTLRAKITEPLGSVTRVALDIWGSAIRIEGPYGLVSTKTCDNRGRPTRTTNAQGQYTTYIWNPTLPFLLDSTYASATRIGTAYAYDANNYYSVKQVRVGGNEQQYIWGHGGRTDSVRAGGPGNSATVYSYASPTDRRPSTVRDPRGHTTTFAYATGGLRNLLSVSNPGGSQSRIDDYYGRDSVVVDKTGNRTTYIYDIFNRVVRATDPLSHTTTTNFDALFPLGIVDAKGQSYSDSVTALGQVSRSTNPAGQVTMVGYDAGGRTRQSTNRRSQTITFTYDSVGRMLSRTTPDGANATYYMEPTGRYRVAQTSESVDTAWSDVAGRDTLVVHRIPGLPALRQLTVSGYDSLGRRLFVQITGGQSQTFGWDQAGRLSGMGNASFYYNNESSLDSLRLANGVVIRDGSDGGHSVTVRHFSTTTTDQNFGHAYAHDAVGRVTARYSADRTNRISYAYDSAGRLVSQQDQIGSSQYCRPELTSWGVAEDSTGFLTCPPYTSFNGWTYSWDEVGNPTGGATVSTPNQLTQFADQTLAYDNDGNLLTRRRNGTVVQQLTWNSIGQLTAVQTNDPTKGINASVTYGYDGLGRRVRKTSSTGGTTYFVWDGQDLLGELDSVGTLVTQYQYYPGATDSPYAVIFRGGTTYFYAAEPQGNVTGLMDSNGAVVATYNYYPFGETRSKTENLVSGATNRLQFAGREYDSETGLYYNRARYYDPSLGRFISEDPIGLNGDVNLYAYAGNDPVNHNDPTGLLTCWPIYQHFQRTYVEASPVYSVGVSHTVGYDMIVGYNCTEDKYLDYFYRDRITQLYPNYFDHGGGVPSAVPFPAKTQPMPKLPLAPSIAAEPELWFPQKSPLACVIELDKITFLTGWAWTKAWTGKGVDKAFGGVVIADQFHSRSDQWAKDCAPPPV